MYLSIKLIMFLSKKHILRTSKQLFILSTIVVIFFSAISLSPQQKPNNKLPIALNEVSFKLKQIAWADSIVSKMNLEQKIGQLFMVSAYSNRSEAEYKKLDEQIKKYHLGGIIFFQGTAYKQAELTNRYQSQSNIPLMIGIDGEWGLGMRLDNATSFPKAITLGATGNNQLVEDVAFEIGKQCKRIGVNVNFAPVADINSNPRNPVINYRSFGESQYNVANLAIAYARGLKKAHVMACAKHFPGHGDTDTDSHRSLPILNHTKKHLDEIETEPFKKMIKDSVGSVMIGHLHVPALESIQDLPASVSKNIIDGFLKNELAFYGLVFTDAMNMRGLLKHYPTGAAEVKALEAGVDVLLQTANLDVAFKAVKSKYEDSTLNINELNDKVKKILMTKYWMGLNSYKPVNLNTINADINNRTADDLKFKVFSDAVTVVKDEEGILPIKHANNLKIASVAISAPMGNTFQGLMSAYLRTKNYTLPYKSSKGSDWKWVADEASKYDVVVISVHELHNLERKDFGVVPETIKMIREISEKTRVIVCVFGNPYSLKLFDEFETLICGYEDEEAAHMAVANVMSGAAASIGKIPVNTLSNDAKLNFGIKTLTLGSIGYAPASDVGMRANVLEKIGDVALQAIKNGEFPGCQILVAKGSKVVYHESFGTLRYGFNEPVTNNTVYDLASLTKVTATLQAIMKLVSEKKLDINQKASFYLKELKNTDKENIIIKDLLLHQAGLKAFIPFWANTKKSGNVFPQNYYRTSDSTGTLLKVASNLFIIPTVKDSVLKWIIESPLQSSKKYVYSDLGLILLQRVVESVTYLPLDVYLERSFYQPLGMSYTGFNILNKVAIENIAPTEIDRIFRDRSIHGTVHDPNAALLGGVAGHAGLFSNTWDLAKLYQMNLNAGVYAENLYFSTEVLNSFTKTQSNLSHRGIGWNKPTKKDGSVSDYSSEATYGHTGFTGTAVWIDPDSKLIYIFLSNRVYPDAENNRLISNRTRMKVHDLVYEAIIK